MKKLFVVLGIGLILIPFVATTVQANDQTVVIGVGLGVHSYETTDDVRGDLFVQGDALNEAVMGQLYGEWYALGPVGFGARTIVLGSGRSITDSLGNNLEHEVSVSLLFLTAQLIVLGSESYARLGVIGGVGGGEYESKVTFTDASTNSKFSASDSTSGSATLGGAFIDWGGDGFGARFGLHVISTEFDDLNGASVDGSGTSAYLDLRWAFD